MTSNSFFKGHALGNDYIVVDPVDLDFQLSPGAIRSICDRNTGVGADGMVALDSSGKADFGVRIYNADGSEAETSGNGLRIFGLYAFGVGKITKGDFRVETKAGVSMLRLEASGDDAHVLASASMGRASFKPKDLPCSLDVPELTEQEVEVLDRRLLFTGVSIGNPHCVVFSRREVAWTRADLLNLGPMLEHHNLFPNRVNVQLVSVVNRSTIEVLIWERGSGETQSSGSSSCAAASAAVRLGFAESPVLVNVPGGSVSVEVDDEFNLVLTGPVTWICDGSLSPDFVKALHGPQ